MENMAMTAEISPNYGQRLEQNVARKVRLSECLSRKIIIREIKYSWCLMKYNENFGCQQTETQWMESHSFHRCLIGHLKGYDNQKAILSL